MIRRLARLTAEVAAAPFWIVGNALMVPLLKKQLRREQTRSKRLESERAEAIRAHSRAADLARAGDIAQLQALTDETEGLAGRMCGAWLNAAVAWQERDAAERMADRLRHGQEIESDYICPDSLRATEAEAERDTLKARLAEAEKTVAVYGAALSGNAAYLDGAEHYPADDKIQGWAAALEHVTRERDTLRREVDTLRRELADADRDHDAAMAELKARHREVLAERDARIASLQKHEGLELYRAAYRHCYAVNVGNGTMRLETGLARHEAVEKWERAQQAK